jgi:hypothetical protein
MKRFRFLALGLLGLSLACAAGKPAFANILIQVDKPTQTMTVSVNGQVRYRWPVSTGATGFSTPAGSYKPFRMEVMHYSMPACRTRSSSLRVGTAFMAPIMPVLVRRCPTVACGSRCQTLGSSISWSRQRAWGNTKVIVVGSDPPGVFSPSQPPQQRRPFSPFMGLFRF